MGTWACGSRGTQGQPGRRWKTTCRRHQPCFPLPVLPVIPPTAPPSEQGPAVSDQVTAVSPSSLGQLGPSDRDHRSVPMCWGPKGRAAAVPRPVGTLGTTLLNGGSPSAGIPSHCPPHSYASGRGGLWTGPPYVLGTGSTQLSHCRVPSAPLWALLSCCAQPACH